MMSGNLDESKMDRLKLSKKEMEKLTLGELEGFFKGYNLGHLEGNGDGTISIVKEAA
jgi:hypothetical protein